MPETVALTIHGVRATVARGTTVAAALLLVEKPSRISVTGEPRSALCGMGVCMECRAVVNGVPHRRTCQLLCEQDMIVETNP